MEKGITNGCIDGIMLSTTSAASCSVKCSDGYSGDDATISCAADAENGADTSGTITCTGEARQPGLAAFDLLTLLLCPENKCNAVHFSVGVEGGDTDRCIDGMQLSTHTDNVCSVKCSDGYSGRDSTVTCAADANDGADTASDIECTGAASLPAWSPHCSKPCLHCCVQRTDVLHSILEPV